MSDATEATTPTPTPSASSPASFAVADPASGAPGAALLAVDLQTTLLRAFSPTISTPLRARAALALNAAQTFRIPIFFTEQVPNKLGHTDPALRALAPAAPVFAKKAFSAFSEEPLPALLREQQIEHLLLIGIETPICIYQTALGALAAGFHVTVLSDAVGSRRPDDHATCLAALRHAGIHVLPVETVFYALLHDVGHPAFKEITALVKTHL